MAKAKTTTATKPQTTLTNGEVLDLSEALARVRGHMRTPRHSYTVSLMRHALRGPAEAIEELRKLGDTGKEFGEYEQARQRLCAEHSRRDGAGEPVITQSAAGPRFDIDPEKREAFQTSLAKLVADNKALVERYNAEVAKFNEFAGQPCADVDLSALPRLPIAGFKDDTPGELIDTLFVVIEA